MAFPMPRQLVLPVEPYHVSGYHFRQRLRRRLLLWATHLGDDVVQPAGKPVRSIGEGTVVWAEVRLGHAKKRNWGGIVIIGHTHRTTGQPFYSLYGHLKDLTAVAQQPVAAEQTLGVVADGNTPENGWWQIPHLHFAIYTGPWPNTILPGYKRPESWRTRLSWWHDPQTFIAAYNLARNNTKQNNRS